MNKKHIMPEIIELSKELANYWRMPIYEGCWVCVIQVKKGGEKFNRKLIDGKTFWIDKDTRQLYCWSLGKIHENDYFPIPSISDCISKLIELDPEWRTAAIVANFHGVLMGNIPLDEWHLALLSVLLEVLKEEK